MLLKKFISYYKPHRKLFAIDMCCSFVVAVCDLFYPIIAKNIINDYVPNQNLRLLLTWAAGMDMVTASATAKPVNLASNISALITRIAAGNVLYALAIPATACSIAGGWLGSRLALKKGAKLVRWVMLGVLALLTVKLAAEWIAG